MPKSESAQSQTVWWKVRSYKRLHLMQEAGKWVFDVILYSKPGVDSASYGRGSRWRADTTQAALITSYDKRK